MVNLTFIAICIGLSAVPAYTNKISSINAANKAESRDVCGGIESIVLTQETDHGFIASPGYPGRYPNSVAARDCGQDLSVDSDSIDSVRLGFLQLRTIYGDYVQLEVRDTAPDLEYVEQLSGISDLFLPLLLAGNNATVFLQSDSAETDIGYLVAYAAELPRNTKDEQIEVEDKSGPGIYEPNSVEVININTETGEITTNGDVTQLHTKVQPGASKQYGFVSSPNHPDPYPNSQTVDYNLSGPSGSRFALRALRTRLETGYDSVYFLEDGIPFAGGYTLMTSIAYSSTNEVTVRFRSDSSNTFSGFLIAYANIVP
ncbi:unnamed protein product [Notodromas monacha]|uniref:CUB domain-containing protein n=1 Tax=Notodromas monacha TaxID=399045 RepID=A0A7R9GCT4_9CRUS|nr:unnamed protein product [Notodromas monacha]CAG0916187.1 unnamed protein product [Notodromas monacha]